MTIPGVNILEQQIIYGPTWYGISIFVIFTFLMIVFIGIFADTTEFKFGLISIISIIGFLISVGLTLGCDLNPTILNRPKKIDYTIEIIDENAWKEIGPNYTVLEKVYNNKEIYVIEGDYNVWMRKKIRK